MKRFINVIFWISSLLLFSQGNIEAQIGRLRLSPTQKIHQKIGLTEIEVEYSRPSKRGRQIFGELVPYHQYWRTGANQNTTIEISDAFHLNGKKVKKGKYAIFTIPRPDMWDFILYEDVDNWDVPEEVDSTKIIARMKVVPVEIESDKEVLSIEIGDFTNYIFDLNIAWEKTQITIPIELSTRELMDNKIKRHLEGPTYGDYYLAAVYQMESGNEFDKGLKWINKAIDVAPEVGWWNKRVKAILLMKLGREKEAKKVAEKGLELARQDERESIILQFEKMLKELE